MDFTSLIVLANALVLGIRHGIDWDHIAAIADIVGTSSVSRMEDGAISLVQSHDAMRLSLSYALGHAATVLLLGTAALMFAAVLPAWIDPLMERAVGITLLLLGAWVLLSLKQSAATKDDFVMQSRWMYLLTKMQQGREWIWSRFSSTPVARSQEMRRYSGASAFGIGAIHGFGAETGTQVLLIAAVGGSSTHVLGIMILLSFITGLLISNTLVALITCAGFANSARFKSVFVVFSLITALFSLALGAVFVSGRADLLPDLQH